MKTDVFAFTSLLTIPVFTPMWVYVISITAAFFTAMILILISDYRTPEQKAEEEAERAQAEFDLALERERKAKAAAGGAGVASARHDRDRQNRWRSREPSCGRRWWELPSLGR